MFAALGRRGNRNRYPREGQSVSIRSSTSIS
jgi:hypothetical protein